MNKHIFLLAILLSILSCSKDVDKTPSKILVESRMLKYKYEFGKLDSTGTMHERILFDRQGRDSLIEKYDNDGLLFISTISYYDSLGNKIKDIDYNPEGKIESKTLYKYLANGKILEENTDRTDGGYSYHKYLYDKNGILKKSKWTSKGYYELGNRWLISDYNIEYIYNDSGYCIAKRYYENGKLAWEVINAYDSLGNKIYDNYGSNPRKYKYDSLGNEIEHLSLDENEKLVWRWVSKYDSNNVLVEYKTFNSLNEPVEVQKKEFIYK